MNSVNFSTSGGIGQAFLRHIPIYGYHNTKNKINALRDHGKIDKLDADNLKSGIQAGTLAPAAAIGALVVGP